MWNKAFRFIFGYRRDDIVDISFPKQRLDWWGSQSPLSSAEAKGFFREDPLSNVLRKSPNCEMGPNFRIAAPPTFFYCPPTFFDEFRYRYFSRPAHVVYAPSLRHSGIIFHCGVAMAHMSMAGRVYERGKALNEDLRRNIIQTQVQQNLTGRDPHEYSFIQHKQPCTLGPRILGIHR